MKQAEKHEARDWPHLLAYIFFPCWTLPALEHRTPSSSVSRLGPGSSCPWSLQTAYCGTLWLCKLILNKHTLSLAIYIYIHDCRWSDAGCYTVPGPRCHKNVTLMKTIWGKMTIPKWRHSTHQQQRPSHTHHPTTDTHAKSFLKLLFPTILYRLHLGRKEPTEPNINHRSCIARHSVFDVPKNPLYTSLCFWPLQPQSPAIRRDSHLSESCPLMKCQCQRNIDRYALCILPCLLPLAITVSSKRVSN